MLYSNWYSEMFNEMFKGHGDDSLEDLMRGNDRSGTEI